ncbi:MAG TPA: FtsX-like permease family protein [Kofleriaceae bacterium]|nr:FtsX-like permease family protein [Kofleriaceae bacterium]
MELGPILRAIRRNKARFGLIAVEVALTLAVVANCLALIGDAREKMAQPSGFDDDNIVRVTSTPFDQAFREDGYLQNGLRADLEALRHMPGVRAALSTGFLPWIGGGSSGTFKRPGGQGPELRSQLYPADEGLIDTLGVHLVEGRQFTRDDVERDTQRLKALFASDRPRGQDGMPSEHYMQDVVISKAWCELMFGPGSCLGKMFEDGDRDLYRVIGVLDPFYNPYAWHIEKYALFYAYHSASFEGGSAYLVRTEPGKAASLARTIEDSLTRQNPLRTVKTQLVTEVRHNFFGPQRAIILLMGLVAVLLVVVTGLGIVGVTSFLVTERIRQIGTRRALGARMIDIVRYFLLENWLVTSLGIVAGVGLAIALNLALVSFASSAVLGAPTVVAGAILLWLLGLVSALVPSLRAARTSPAVATRSV